MSEQPTPDAAQDSSPGRRPKQRLPAARRLVGFMYVGRVAVGVAFLGRGVWAADQTPGIVVTGALLLAATLLVTGASYAYSHRRERVLPAPFLYAQLLYDTLVLSLIVGLTGGGASVFSPLFILLICAAALMLPFYGSLIFGGAATSIYFAVVTTSSDIQQGAVLLQIALFLTVALVMSLLGDRLRETGTALGEVETELRQLRLDTDDILGTISTGIITVDGEGKLMYMNPAARDLLDLADLPLGEPVLRTLDSVAPGLGRVIHRTAATRSPVHRFETDPISDDDFVLGVSTTLVERGGNGDRPAVTAIFQNITQKMRVEGLRRRAERLEAVAELSASLAHEIKNPLASIRSAVEQIGGDTVDADDRRLLTKLVIRESDRLSRLLTEFIDFARVKMTAPGTIDFPALVREVVELVRAHPDAEGRTIQLEVDGAEERMRIRGAEDLLHRAVLNLVLNGAQWAGENGVVRLRLSEVRTDLLLPALGDRALVRLTVSDTGPGIAEEIVEHIFNPFFTRRAGGTGLGLAMVQRAVEAHGGAIFVDAAGSPSQPGATFALYLPTAGAEIAGGAEQSNHSNG